MKCKYLFLLISAIILVSCGMDHDAINQQIYQESVKYNAEQQLGITIDPNQTWNAIKEGSITVTADANLEDIVKVQILTESPFYNDEARVLNSVNCKRGDVVTITYEIPAYLTELVASCVNSKGIQRIKVFKVGDLSVSFGSSSRARTRAAASEIPSFTSIKLKSPVSSFNAKRAQQGASCTIGGKVYTEWSNSNWENELMWDLADGQTFDNGWKLDTEKNKGHIFRDIAGFDEGELATVKNIINNILYKYTVTNEDKTYGVNNRRNNLRVIKQSPYFTLNNNYIYTNGKGCVTLIPIQAYTDEFKMDHIYYYYYKPEDVPADMNEVDYIKSLPKYKAIQVERIETTPQSKEGAYFRNKEFLLPYYKNAPQVGDNEASAVFPAGYKIGFLNMKYSNGNYSYGEVKHGCTYGDGRLNFAVNHIVGHFKTAMDTSIGGSVNEGMQFEDPRIACFSANGKTYMAFEEGADCNFSDIIIEIGGINVTEPEKEETEEIVVKDKSGASQTIISRQTQAIETLEPIFENEANVYTMCFEDRPVNADYDMNDVVLKASREDNHSIRIRVVACGAQDIVTLCGIEGEKDQSRYLNNREIHDILHIGMGTFANTGGQKAEEAWEVVETGNMTIAQFLKNIYIENNTTKTTIKMPTESGEPPCVIIVPFDFRYPKEGKNITKAYKGFLDWAKDLNQNIDWYTAPEQALIYDGN